MFRFGTSWKDQFPIGSAIFTKTAVAGINKVSQTANCIQKDRSTIRYPDVCPDLYVSVLNQRLACGFVAAKCVKKA